MECGAVSMRQSPIFDYYYYYRVSPKSLNPVNLKSQFVLSKSNHRISMEDHNFNAVLLARAHQSGSGYVSVGDAKERDLKIKEWEARVLQEAMASSQGITIRRRPPIPPPLGYDGPFEVQAHDISHTPRNILEEIIWYKDIEVSQLKAKQPFDALEKAVADAPQPRDFIGALRAACQRTGLPGLIAEVKKASPSRGIIRHDFNPVEIAKAYEKGGAACLSVLTDEKFFQGCFENLEAIRSAGIECPLLCKEFIVDAWQIYYARAKGADAVLLIAGVLPDLDIKYFLTICKKLGLTALVEVHDEMEMDRVLGIEGIELIGINNRDLGTFKVDISNTRKLLDRRRLEILNQKNIIVVGESGLFTPDDISFVQEAGVKAVLVGESLVKQDDPSKGIANLFGKDISFEWLANAELGSWLMVVMFCIIVMPYRELQSILGNINTCNRKIKQLYLGDDGGILIRDMAASQFGVRGLLSWPC